MRVDVVWDVDVGVPGVLCIDCIAVDPESSEFMLKATANAVLKGNRHKDLSLGVRDED